MIIVTNSTRATPVIPGSRGLCILDGSNFYHRLRELGFLRINSFQYSQFALLVSSQATLVSKNFYIGAVREEKNNTKSFRLMQTQRRLTGRLRHEGWKVTYGHLLKTVGYHEKGVDVQMAIDIVSGAYENSYDTLVLVSSDTDLIPAVMKARHMGKRAHYVGFRHRPSFGLAANSDSHQLFTGIELEHFLPRE